MLPSKDVRGTRMPCSFKNSWPGFSFHLLFERRKSWGERQRDSEEKKDWATWKNHDLKKAETCPEGSRVMWSFKGDPSIQWNSAAATDQHCHAKMHCQWMWSLQVALRLPTPQYWHGDTILDCAGGSSQSKRSFKIEEGWMERRPAWWDMFRVAWFENTKNLASDNRLISRLTWEREGVNRNVMVSPESLADAKWTPQEGSGEHVSCLPT